MDNHDTSAPHTVPVGEPFKQRTGIGRDGQYALICRGEVESALIGARPGRRVILWQSWLDYLERQRRREVTGEIGGQSPNPRARRTSR